MAEGVAYLQIRDIRTKLSVYTGVLHEVADLCPIGTFGLDAHSPLIVPRHGQVAEVADLLRHS
jgi:hypothetical protein